MPNDSEKNLEKEQLKAALGMSAPKQYETIEGEKMAKELIKEKGVKNLKFDEKSIDKAEQESREIAEGIVKGLTPLSPINQEVPIKEITKGDKFQTTTTTQPQTQAQAQTQPPSTRDNQKQINRVDKGGEKIQPRLAEPNRVQPQQEQQPSPVASGIRGAAKKAASKALPIALPIASGFGGAALAYFIA